MRLIDADKIETTAVLRLKLQHANSRYYYFYEEETIEKAPTVKAIPVEWIEKRYGWLTMAGEIIKDWEAERGADK